MGGIHTPNRGHFSTMKAALIVVLLWLLTIFYKKKLIQVWYVSNMRHIFAKELMNYKFKTKIRCTF